VILFVVNDAGPAKYLAYVAKKLDKNQYRCISSNISSKIFTEFGIKSSSNINDININIKSIDLIVTGTCLQSGIDKEFIQIAKRYKIKTISIIEHWSLYKKRFELNERYFFPDKIFINDSLAFEEAINSGIERELLQIMGNPVLEYIKKKNYSNKEKLKWKEDLQIHKEKKITTFISESLREDFPKGSKDYQGFDEFDVLNDILINLRNENVLIVKLHPEESKEKYNFLKIFPNILIFEREDVGKLISFSDTLVGMGSMLLIEAAMTESNVYSYRPNEKISFVGNTNGMVKKINNTKELKAMLALSKSSNNFKVINKFKGSTSKIVQNLQSYL
jgi:hypothetical protein